MKSPPETADLIRKRRDVLQVISEPSTKPEMVDSLSLSRSTIDRAIAELQAASLISRNGSRYVTTYAGRNALHAYDEFLARVDSLISAQPVLDALPPSVDIDPAVLDGATIIESRPAAPEAPIEATIEQMERAERFRGTGPAVTPLYIDVVARIVEDNGTETEIVVTDTVIEVLTETYPDGFDTLLGADGLSIYATEQPMSYAVWTAEMTDGAVSGIIAYGENGVTGIVNNDTDVMNKWAKEQYDQFRTDARRLD